MLDFVLLPRFREKFDPHLFMDLSHLHGRFRRFLRTCSIVANWARSLFAETFLEEGVQDCRRACEANESFTTKSACKREMRATSASAEAQF